MISFNCLQHINQISWFLPLTISVSLYFKIWSQTCNDKISFNCLISDILYTAHRFLVILALVQHSSQQGKMCLYQNHQIHHSLSSVHLRCSLKSQKPNNFVIDLVLLKKISWHRILTSYKEKTPHDFTDWVAFHTTIHSQTLNLGFVTRDWNHEEDIQLVLSCPVLFDQRQKPKQAVKTKWFITVSSGRKANQRELCLSSQLRTKIDSNWGLLFISNYQNSSLAAEAGFVFYSKEGMTLGIWTELSSY